MIPRFESFSFLGSKIEGIGSKISGIASRIAGAASAFGFDLGSVTGAPTPALAGAGAAPALPAGAAEGARPGVEAIRAQAASGPAGVSAEDIAGALAQQPVQLTSMLNVDGQVLAEVVETVDRRNRATGFGSVDQEE